MAEEALLSAARLCRAFANLDHSLATSPAGSSARAAGTEPKARAEPPRRSRSPRRDPRPPIPRSPARPREVERRAEREPSDEESDFDEEEEEDERLATEVKKEYRGTDRPPEPDDPPPGYPKKDPPRREDHRERQHSESKRKGHKRPKGSSGRRRTRGGAKHQKRYKDQDDPLRRSHRRLRAEHLALAPLLPGGIGEEVLRRSIAVARLAMAGSREEEEGRHSLAPGEPGYADRVRDSLVGRPKPTVPQDYDVDEAALWQHRHLPIGSVIEFVHMGEDGITAHGRAALLITNYHSDEDGIWLEVNVLGAEEDDTKKELQKYFKQGRRQVHICYPPTGGDCPLAAEHGLHLRKFRWFPAGDYQAGFLSAYANKKVREGPQMEMAASTARKRSKDARPPVHDVENSETEARLSALRRRAPRVSFADLPDAPRSLGLDGSGLRGRPDGTLKEPGARSSALDKQKSLRDRVKVETIDLEQVEIFDEEDAAEDGRCAGQSGRVATAAGREAREEQEQKEEEEEKEKGEEEELQQRGRLGGELFLERQQLATSPTEATLHEETRIGVEDARGTGLRIPHQGRGHGCGGRSDGSGPETKTGHLLPAGLEAFPGSSRARLQRAGTVVPRSRHVARGKARWIRGYAGSKADGCRNSHKTRMARGPPSRDLQHRRRRIHAGPHLAGRSAARQTGGEGWRQRILGALSNMVHPWSAEARPKGKGLNAKGKGKKGKGKGKGGKNWNLWGAPNEKPDGKKPGETPSG